MKPAVVIWTLYINTCGSPSLLHGYKRCTYGHTWTCRYPDFKVLTLLSPCGCLVGVINFTCIMMIASQIILSDLQATTCTIYIKTCNGGGYFNRASNVHIWDSAYHWYFWSFTLAPDRMILDEWLASIHIFELRLVIHSVNVSQQNVGLCIIESTTWATRMQNSVQVKIKGP